MSIIHTMPMMIRGDNLLEQDLRMAQACLESLSLSDDTVVVIYNQGVFSNQELQQWLSPYPLRTIILGDGHNCGIAPARQACFEYIWRQFPEVQYISEVHVDMAFPRNWHTPLIEFLEQSDEPMVCPGIVTSSGELQPTGQYAEIPTTQEQLLGMINHLAVDEIQMGFVHPVVHKSAVLRKVGGYDTKFLTGKQGYEDDSLLLGYSYYMGTRTNWRPKCNLQSWVYHATMAQRMSLTDKHKDFALNEKGLVQQYGIYGLKRLAELYPQSTVFNELITKYFVKGD